MASPQAAIGGIAAFEATWGLPAIRSTVGVAASVAVPASAPAKAPQCGASAPAAPAFSILGVIPDSDFGRTYVWDSATAKFRPGPTTGGPAGGVEFDLPAVDSLNRVLFPIQTTGTLDLFDITSGGPLTVHSVITGTAGNGSADYAVSDTGDAVVGYAGVLTGAVRGGGRTFTFLDSLSGVYQQLKALATVTDSGSGTKMKLIATRTQTDPFDYFYDLDFTQTTTAQRIRLLGNITVYCLIPSTSLTVTVNDSDYAIVNSGLNGPVITPLADSIVTPAQDSAIRSLIRGQNELFSWLAGLSQPTRQFLP